MGKGGGGGGGGDNSNNEQDKFLYRSAMSPNSSYIATTPQLLENAQFNIVEHIVKFMDYIALLQLS